MRTTGAFRLYNQMKKHLSFRFSHWFLLLVIQIGGFS